MPHRSWRLLILVCCILLLVPLYQLHDNEAAGHYKQYVFSHLSAYLDSHRHVYNNTLYVQGTEAVVYPQWNFSSPCSNFPNTDDIMLVMKTGATESYDKMPMQILTSLQCLPDFLLFSDLEQQIGQYHAYDALDRVEEVVKQANEEFKLYDAQHACPVSQKDCTSGMGGGWDLDKFKFLNMVVQTWEKRPGRKWYVFAEADTYIVWPNMVHWIRNRASSDKDLYVGSMAMMGGFPFAHGGSGYVVSGSLMKKLIEEIPNVAAKYDAIAANECCGDVLIARALHEVGSKVQQAHPMFNGEKPNTLPYGNGHWCEPILTMHHMNSEEVSSVWQYERTRTKKEPMQIKELYYTFFAPNLVHYRKDWDNLSDDVCYIGLDKDSQDRAGGKERRRQKAEWAKNAAEKYAHMSAAACANVCEAENLNILEDEFEGLDTDAERGHLIHTKYEEQGAGDKAFSKKRSCFQWRYHHRVCCTSKSFRLGKPRREIKESDAWASGWFVRGINDWIEAQGECEVAWKEPK